VPCDWSNKEARLRSGGVTLQRTTQTERLDARETAGQPKAPGLVLILERERPTTLPFRLEGPLEFGRESPQSLKDEHVSRRHARVALDEGGLRITDLGSRNGTFVDGVQLRNEAVFREPRVLRVGRNLLLFAPDVTPFERFPTALRSGVIVGPTLRKAYASIGRAAKAGDTVLVCGESGVGKELGARQFHAQGPYPNGPFVAVNCAAIPQGLAERLLFGARRGAYSGAAVDAEGYLQAAHRGTLFLDEVGELEPPVQAKLLRALERKEALALGAARATPVDVRICAATLTDLRRNAAAGKFREDLFYRLAQHAVELPPLRQRLEEVPHLIAHELSGIEPQLQMRAAFVEACLLRPWPGNIRELKGEVRRCALLAKEEGASELQVHYLGETAGRSLGLAARHSSGPTREAIEAALLAEQGNVSAAARALNIHRNQLRRLLSRHGLDAKAWSSSQERR